MQDLSRFHLPIGFRGRPGWYVQLWWLVEGTLFRMSPQFMYGWRRFLLRAFGARIGVKVLIRPTARVTFPWKLTVGDFSWIGDDVVLYSLANIEIETNVVISQRSYICTGSHEVDSPSFNIFALPIKIAAGAWIATDVFVAPGISIGAGAVIGARSGVFNDISPMTICVGTPARPVRSRAFGPGPAAD